jgi:hypothetical protein
VVIRKLVRSLLKLVWFIALFCLVSWVDVHYFSLHPMISNDTAIRIAHWLNSNPTPEDIYYSYDYILIGFNLISSFILYIVIVKLIKKARSK